MRHAHLIDQGHAILRPEKVTTNVLNSNMDETMIDSPIDVNQSCCRQEVQDRDLTMTEIVNIHDNLDKSENCAIHNSGDASTNHQEHSNSKIRNHTLDANSHSSRQADLKVQFVSPPPSPPLVSSPAAISKSTDQNQFQCYSQEQYQGIQQYPFKPMRSRSVSIRSRSVSMTFSTSTSQSSDLQYSLSSETNTIKPQHSLSLNCSRSLNSSNRQSDIIKLHVDQNSNEDNINNLQSPSYPATPSTMSTTMSLTSSSSQSLSTRFDHGLLSPFSPIVSTGTCRSEDSYEMLLKPMNETFQRNLQESFDRNNSTGSRNQKSLDDSFRYIRDEDDCSVQRVVHQSKYYGSGDEETSETGQEQCNICSKDEFFLNHLFRFCSKLGDIVWGIQVPPTAIIDNFDYSKNNDDYNHPYKPSAQVGEILQRNNTFVSYNCDYDHYEDYDEEIAQFQKASKSQQRDDHNEVKNESHESHKVCREDKSTDENASNTSTPPTIPDLDQVSKSPIVPLSPRVLYEQFDSEQNHEAQHPLLCPKTPKSNSENNANTSHTNGERNVSWTTFSSHSSPKHDSMSDTNLFSLSSSKCFNSPTSTTSPLIDHPLAQLENSNQKSNENDSTMDNVRRHKNDSMTTTTSNESPQHHLLNSTVASIDLNLEFEWQQQALKCEQEGDYTHALYFYGLCLNQHSEEKDKQFLSPYEEEREINQLSASERNKTISIVSLLHKIGIIQWKIGSYDLSLKALEEALLKAQSLIPDKMSFGEEDNTLWIEEKESLSEILNSIGRTHVSLGSYDIAMKYHLESLALLSSIQSASINCDDESFVRSEIDVHDEKSLIKEDELFSKLNQSASEDDQYQCPEQEEAMKLNSHPGIARTMICIGIIHNRKGNHLVAMARFRDGYEIQRKTVGPDHVDIGATLNAIGSVYEMNGDHSKAMRCYKKAYKVYIGQLGDMHVDVAVTLNYIGQVYHALKKYKKAMDAFNRALDIMRMVLGEDHRNVATTLFNKALVYKACGKYDKALKIFKDTLEVQMKALGECHIDVALTYLSLGDVHEEIGNIDKAKNLIHKALKIRRSALGENHIVVAKTHDRLGQLYFDNHCDLRKASKRFCEALKCYRLNNLDDNDPLVVNVIQKIQALSSTI